MLSLYKFINDCIMNFSAEKIYQSVYRLWFQEVVCYREGHKKMRNIALFLLMISGFVFGSCNGSPADVVDDDADEQIDDGTLLAEASFEGSMLPFSHLYDGADIYADSTAPDGSRVLRFTYPPGHPSGYSTGLVWVWFEQGFQEVRVEYHFRYSDNFFFHRVDNKQTYIDIGDQTNFFLSAVDPFNIGGTGIPTEIHFICQYGNIGSAIRKTPNVLNVAIHPNVWYKVTLYFRLNKDGQPDGILKVWVDDTQIMDYSDIVFNTGSDANKPFTCLKFDPVWGGAGGPKPNATDYFYVDAVKIWAGPFKSIIH